MSPLKVLYFGSYDQNGGRNAIVMEALGCAGVEIAQNPASVWADTEAKLRAAGSVLGVLWGSWRQLAAWPSLVRRALRATPDVILVGATAYADVPVAAMVARKLGVPMAFDPLVSIVETIRDRRLAAEGSPRLRALTRLERFILGLPDAVLVDTVAHARAMTRSVGLRPERTVLVPAGAPRAFDHARPAEPAADRPTEVLYFGQYIPLHGLPTVLGAARQLLDTPTIRFRLVGRGQDLDATRRLAAELQLDNTVIETGWWPARELVARFVSRAHICLGIFGDQAKADSVVPFKVYGAMAAERPVVTANTTAVRELLAPGQEVLCVPPGDSEALAAAIKTLADSPNLRSDLSGAAGRAYRLRFSPEVIGPRLRDGLEALAQPARGPADLGSPHLNWVRPR